MGRPYTPSLFATTLWACLLIPLAAPADKSEPLSITQAMEIAQRSNLALRQVEGRVELARIGVDSSRTAFYPSLSAHASSLGRVHGRSKGVTGTDGVLSGTLSASLGSNLNLFNGYAHQAALHAAELDHVAGRDELARQRQAVVFGTISAFLQVVTFQEYLEVGRRHLEAQSRLLEQIREFHKAGKRPIADVYQQEAEVAAAELTLLGAQGDMQVAKLQLSQILGRSPVSTIEIVPVDVDGLVAGLSTDAGDTAEAMSRPDILAQQHRMEAALEQIRVARAGYLPSLDLSLEAGSAYSTDGVGTFAEQLAGERLGATLGLSLSIPLFDRGLTATQVEQAQVEQANARLALQELGQEAQLAVLQAEKDHTTALKQLGVAASRLNSAAQSLAALEERYRVGASTLAEISLVRAQHLQAAYDRVETKVALLLSAVAVRYQRGDLAGMVSLFEGREAS